MSWLISAKYKDPYFTNVSLLLHGNGTNGSATITDNSPSPKTVTAVGDAKISTAISNPFGANNGIIAFDGNGDYLTLPNTAAMALESSNCTVEAWIRVASFANAPTIYATGETSSSGFLFCVSTLGGLQVFSQSTGPNIGSTHLTETLSANVWYHVALTRETSTWRVFLNGVQQGSTTNSGTYSANASMFVGARTYTGSVGGFFDGYIDDLRITKGVARYTASFTPPTAQFPDL
jgi:hypothetical protein